MSLCARARAVIFAGVITGGAALAATVPGTASATATCPKVASPTGSDSNAGTASSPYRTAQKVVDSLATGQTGCLNAGTYSGDVTIRTDGVTLRSTPGDRATVSLKTLEIADGAEDVTVSDLNIVGGSGALTMRPIGDRFRILRNDITNNNAGMTCILVGGSSITTSGGVISTNRIHNCGAIGNTLDHGIYAQNFAPASADTPGLTVEDNVLYQHAGYAVQLYPYGIGAIVRHNVIDGGGLSVRGGIVIDGSTALNDILSQNVIAYTQTGGVVQRTGSGHQSTNNCFWQNPPNVSGSSITSSGDITADPGFVNRSAGDNRLAAGSACLSKVGYDTAAEVDTALAVSADAAPTNSAPTVEVTPTNSAPTVEVTSPAPGSTVSRNLRATATASDDHGVVKVQFLIDGIVFGTEYSAPYDQWLSVGSLKRGTHALTATAYDAAGLTGTASVYFSKR
jgi:hypothetical protein